MTGSAHTGRIMCEYPYLLGHSSSLDVLLITASMPSTAIRVGPSAVAVATGSCGGATEARRCVARSDSPTAEAVATAAAAVSAAFGPATGRSLIRIDSMIRR